MITMKQRRCSITIMRVKKGKNLKKKYLTKKSLPSKNMLSNKRKHKIVI